MPVGNTTLTWVEQSPLVMGIGVGSAQVARVLREGADIVDLGRASGAFVREVRHTHTGVPVAVDVAGVTGRTGRAREVAAARPDLLYASDGVLAREVAALAAESGAAVVCSVGDVEWLRAEGVARVFVTPGWGQSASVRTLRRGRELAAGEWPVLLTVSDGAGPDGPASGVGAQGGLGHVCGTEGHLGLAPEAIAAAAFAAMAGVRILRTDRVIETRRTVDMIASIAGTRQPARVRRALA